MVQLSASGLGIPSHTGQGLSDALRMGTQGFLAGKQLAMQQRDQQMKQAAYEQALKKAQFELQQEQSQAAAMPEAGRLLGQAGQFQPENIQNNRGAVGTQGPLLPSEQSRQNDFAQLQQHHRDVTEQASKIVAKLDPQFARQFWSDIQTGMKQDAMNLARIHVADSLHDAAGDGSLDIVDPRTGERVPSEDISKTFAEMADRVKRGEMDPMQAQQALDQTRQKLNAEAGEVKQRIMLAEGAGQQLLEQGPFSITPFQLSTIDALKTGQISAEQWQGIAPYVMAGMVPDPSGGRGWMTPEHAQAEMAQLQAQTRQQNALASYNETVKPAIEFGKLEQGDKKIASQERINLDKIASQERIAKERNATARAIAADRLAEQARKAATEAGFSDAKALDKALTHATQEFKEGLIKDEEGYQPRVEELLKGFKTKGAGSSSADPAEVKLIGDMKAQGKSAAEIREAVLKLRGGK